MEFFGKKDIAERVGERCGLSKVQATEVTDAVFNAFKEFLVDDSKDGVDICRMFKFTVTDVPEKTARNPRSGESVVVPAHNVIRVKVSKGLKDLVR